MKIFSIMLSIAMIVGMYGCQSAPSRTSGSVEVASDDARVKIIFSNHDRELIHHYYSQGKRKQIPPGLAKKEQLPPGLQKQIKKHGKLPPGLEGRYLPHDLEQRLERLPKGYVRIRVGTDIILMETATRVILDVILDVAY